MTDHIEESDAPTTTMGGGHIATRDNPMTLRSGKTDFRRKLLGVGKRRCDCTSKSPYARAFADMLDDK